MRLLFFLSVILSVHTVNVCAQDSFYPHYIANPLEARVGSFYQPNADRLRLDIGQTIDLKQYDVGSGWNAGIGA
ncbi:MAG: hypothetical protein RJA11_1661, partial [Bacteroidota bacterium]